MRLTTLLLILIYFSLPAFAQSDEYTGTMGDTVPDAVYPLSLSAGDTVTALAEATSGNLDPYLILQDNDGNTVSENDDIEFGNLNSQIIYTVPNDGNYTLILTNIIGTSGDYRLTITIEGGRDTDFSAQNVQPQGDDLVFTGFMSDTTADAEYEFYMEIGQGVIFRIDDTSGTLDPVAAIKNPDGEVVAYNDDRELNNLNSQAVYVAEVSGTYTAVVSNFSGTSGEYRATIAITTAQEAEDRSRLELSGPRLTRETPNFIIHYTNEGPDAATEEYIDAVAKALEEVYAVQIGEQGWPIPPNDRNRGGDERYDVYITDLISEYAGGDLGFASPEFPSADNPNTVEVETNAVPSYLALDNDYLIGIPADEVIPLMRATSAHEFHHAIQFGYDQAEPFNWYFEATATWMETITLPPDQDATGYVGSVFTYPEVCLGAQGASDPTGSSLMYGTWLFMQSLADVHGDAFIQTLWRNIADYDGWEPLERALSDIDDTLVDAAARYHLQNLVRDYELTPLFNDDVVWSEATIDNPGAWSFSGDGIQELAANYYTLSLSPGVYDFKLTNDNGQLQLFAVGIRGEEAEVFDLGRGNTVNLSGYDYANLMVFNPAYGDVNACAYQSYGIEVSQSTGIPLTPQATRLNAQHYASTAR